MIDCISMSRRRVFSDLRGCPFPPPRPQPGQCQQPGTCIHPPVLVSRLCHSVTSSQSHCFTLHTFALFRASLASGGEPLTFLRCLILASLFQPSQSLARTLRLPPQNPTFPSSPSRQTQTYSTTSQPSSKTHHPYPTHTLLRNGYHFHRQDHDPDQRRCQDDHRAPGRRALDPAQESARRLRSRGRCRGGDPSPQRERDGHEEGGRVVRASPQRPARQRQRRLGQPQEDDRHRRVGPEVHAGRPGDAVRDHLGGQLPRHQAAPRRRMQDRREHDQGQVARGDPQDLQHPERLHARGGGADPPRERVGRGPITVPFPQDEHVTRRTGEAKREREARRVRQRMRWEVWPCAKAMQHRRRRRLTGGRCIRRLRQEWRYPAAHEGDM